MDRRGRGGAASRLPGRTTPLTPCGWKSRVLHGNSTQRDLYRHKFIANGQGGPHMSESDQRNCRARTLVDGNGHICAFFHSREEARRTLLPFIADGLEKGEKAVHIVNANDRDEHLRWLREFQID